MPLNSKWHPLVEGAVEGVPAVVGVYELGDRNREVVYIGGSDTDIREALRYHMNTAPVDVKRFRVLTSLSHGLPQGVVRGHVRRFVRRNQRLPKYQKSLSVPATDAALPFKPPLQTAVGRQA